MEVFFDEVITSDILAQEQVVDDFTDQNLGIPVVEGELELTYALPVEAAPVGADKTLYVMNSYVRCQRQIEALKDYITDRAVECQNLSLLDTVEHYGAPRLRMTHNLESGSNTYYLQAKLDVPGMPCSASEELSLEIAESEYFNFLRQEPDDSDDVILNAYFKREQHQGMLDDGTQIIAEVDTLMGFGSFKDEEIEEFLLEPARAPLAKVDIEVPRLHGEPYEKVEQRIALIRNGFHNLSFLDCAYELTLGTEKSEELRRAVRKKKLAESGYRALAARQAVRSIKSFYNANKVALEKASAEAATA